MTSVHGDPVLGGMVTFTPPGSGASAVFPGGNTARINSFGLASINAGANSISGGPYSATASSRGASSANFSLTNTDASSDKLEFLQQPTDTTYGNSISPAVTVEVVDQNDNIVDSTASITISLGTDPTDATLGGTLTVNAVAGIATFSDLTVSLVGTYYALAATSPGLTAALPSSFFNITPRAITVTAVMNTKTYDATTTAAAVPVITSGSLVGSDTADFVETYSTSNVGTGLTLTPSGVVNDGNDGNNYTYTFVPVSTGVITAEALTITAVANSKTYDGTTTRQRCRRSPPAACKGPTWPISVETYSTQQRGDGIDADAEWNGGRRQRRQQLHVHVCARRRRV